MPARAHVPVAELPMPFLFPCPSVTNVVGGPISSLAFCLPALSHSPQARLASTLADLPPVLQQGEQDTRTPSSRSQSRLAQQVGDSTTSLAARPQTHVLTTSPRHILPLPWDLIPPGSYCSGTGIRKPVLCCPGSAKMVAAWYKSPQPFLPMLQPQHPSGPAGWSPAACLSVTRSVSTCEEEP